jgi:hypothetical protein
LDNAPELMQELAHESGARWAVHGTPASGVGIVGLLRAGLTVFAIARDKEHVGGRACRRFPRRRPPAALVVKALPLARSARARLPGIPEATLDGCVAGID